MSFLPVVSHVEDALRSWHLHGGIRLRPEDTAQYHGSLADLLAWCQKKDCWMMDPKNENFLWEKNRVDEPQNDEWKSRYSLNHWENESDEAWRGILRHFEDDTLCGNICAAVAAATNGGTVNLHMCGGDVARVEASKGQHLHSDRMEVAKPSEAELDACEWLVCSIAVHDVSLSNAPLCFVGKQNMLADSHDEAPCLVSELDHPPSCPYIDMRKGDVFIRNPLVWHCGTPNYSDSMRFLPALVFHMSTGKSGV